MASIPSAADVLTNNYPTSDGKPMAETDWHRKLMTNLIATLEVFYSAKARLRLGQPAALLRGRQQTQAPRAGCVRGQRRAQRHPCQLSDVAGGQGTDFVIELTSSTTRHEDRTRKYKLYQDVLKVKEYFLFDPREDYLDPPEQGYRLRAGVYRPIRVVAGRLPSQVLGLHLERDGDVLRLWNPVTGEWLPTSDERAAQAEAARQQEANARQQEANARREAEAGRQQEANARRQAEAENERLPKEMEELRRRLPEDAGQEE